MFRRVLCSVVTEISPGPFSQMQVRWRHKPRWLPVAKTKKFRVTVRPNLPEDELDEIKRLYNAYRTQIKSLREHFKERTLMMSTGEEVLAEIAKKEEEAHEEAKKINDAWNAELAKHRQAVLSAEKEKEALEILEAVEQAKAAALEMKNKAEELVRLEKERAKTFITPENIDEAIAAALDNPIDVEFAIDLDENIILGRRTKPQKLKLSPDEPHKAAASA